MSDISQLVHANLENGLVLDGGRKRTATMFFRYDPKSSVKSDIEQASDAVVVDANHSGNSQKDGKKTMESPRKFKTKVITEKSSQKCGKKTVDKSPKCRIKVRSLQKGGKETLEKSPKRRKTVSNHHPTLTDDLHHESPPPVVQCESSHETKVEKRLPPSKRDSKKKKKGTEQRSNEEKTEREEEEVERPIRIPGCQKAEFLYSSERTGKMICALGDNGPCPCGKHMALHMEVGEDGPYAAAPACQRVRPQGFPDDEWEDALAQCGDMAYYLEYDPTLPISSPENIARVLTEQKERADAKHKLYLEKIQREWDEELKQRKRAVCEAEVAATASRRNLASSSSVDAANTLNRNNAMKRHKYARDNASSVAKCQKGDRTTTTMINHSDLATIEREMQALPGESRQETDCRNIHLMDRIIAPVIFPYGARNLDEAAERFLSEGS